MWLPFFNVRQERYVPGLLMLLAAHGPECAMVVDQVWLRRIRRRAHLRTNLGRALRADRLCKRTLRVDQSPGWTTGRGRV